MTRKFLLLLAVLAIAAYLNTFGHGFVYDDFLWVIDQPAIRSIGNVPQFFTSGQLSNRVYRPLVLVSFTFDYAVAGLRPWFYHAVSIALHSAITVLVFLLFRRFGQGKAWIAAAVFAVMPIHSEAVASVTSRSELLAAFFGLLALLYLERPLLAGGLLVLALLAKETALAVPALAPLLWWRAEDRPPARRAVYSFAALCAAVIVYLGIRRLAGCCELFPPYFLYAVDNPLAICDLATRLRTAAMIVAQNFAASLVPIHFAADYSYPQIPLVESWLEPRFLAWMSLLAGAAAGAWSLHRRRPALARGLAWFLLAIAPVSNIVFPIGTVRADRLVYLPSIGAAIIAAEALWAAVAARRRLGWVLAGTVILSFGIITLRRNGVWKDEPTFYRALVTDSPNSAKAHFELGSYQARQNNCEQALPHLRRAMQLYEHFDLAREAAAGCLERTGDASGARVLYDELAMRYPGEEKYASALYRICNQLQDWSCAARTMDRFIGANARASNDEEAWMAAGHAWMKAGDAGRAETAFRTLVRFSPGARHHAALAAALASQGRYAEAVAEYEAAAAAGDLSVELYEDWASTADRAGNRQLARKVAREGLARFPKATQLRRFL